MKIKMHTTRRVIVTVAIVLLAVLAGLLSRANIYRAFDLTPNAFYVSPTGNDSNPGTSTQPFLTIQKARDYIRLNNKAGSVVYLRDGQYQVDSPITFGSTDSGTSTASTVYRNYPGEHPTIVGSHNVPLTVGSSGIVSFDLNSLGLSGKTIKEVYFNGNREVIARSPNYTTPDFTKTDPWAGQFYYATTDTPASQTVVKYDPTAFDPTPWVNVPNIQMTIFSGLNYWSNTLPVQSIDTANHLITLTSPASYTITGYNRFFLQNASSMLNAPNEWFYDSSTGTLKFYLPNTVQSSDELTVVTSGQAFSLSGASYLRFQGITLQELGDNAFTLSNSNYVDLNGLTIKGVDGYGATISGTSHDDTVHNSTISFTKKAGVQLTPDISFIKTLTPMKISVTNNVISDVDLLAPDGPSGIEAKGVGFTIANNTIHDIQTHGIRMWESVNSTVNNNRIYNVMRSVQDGAGIYIVSIEPGTNRTWLVRGNTISNNFVSDTGGYYFDKTTNAYNFGNASSTIRENTWGIYLDDNTSSTLVENNIVTRAHQECYDIHSGRQNTFRNNYCYSNTPQVSDYRIQESETYNVTDYKWQYVQNLAANGYDAAKYTTNWPDLNNVPQVPQAGQVMTNNRFEYNINYSASPATANMASIYLMSDSNTFDNNLYFADGGRSVEWNGTTPDNVQHRWLLADWQAAGRDIHGKMADPLFVDPAHDNFTLQANSPALAMGIKQIDQSKIGAVTPTPSAPTVTAQLNTSSTPVVLQASWTAADPNLFTVMDYQYQIRQSSATGTIIRDWTPTNDNTLTVSDLTFDPTLTYYLVVEARNDAPVLAANTIWSTSGGITTTSNGSNSSPAPTPTAVSILSYSVSTKTATSFTVSWTTNVASTGTLNWGVNNKLGKTATDSATGTAHKVTVTGLTASTKYFFQIVSTGSDGSTAKSVVTTARTNRK